MLKKSVKVFAVLCSFALVCALALFLYRIFTFWRLTWEYVELKGNDTVVMNGEINANLLRNFRELMQETDLHGKRLIVRSMGGTLLIGIEFGKLIYELQMDVEVNEICVSACANYIFTAGINKYLNHNSGLIFHGGVRQENLKEKLNDPNQWGKNNHEASVEKASMEEMQEIAEQAGVEQKDVNNYDVLLRRETEFFELIGVNPLITVYGQRGEYETKYKSGHHSGFSYSLHDLKKFGVDNVHVIGDQEWRSYRNPYERSAYWAKVTEDELPDMQ